MAHRGQFPTFPKTRPLSEKPAVTGVHRSPHSAIAPGRITVNRHSPRPTRQRYSSTGTCAKALHAAANNRAERLTPRSAALRKSSRRDQEVMDTHSESAHASMQCATTASARVCCCSTHTASGVRWGWTMERGHRARLRAWHGPGARWHVRAVDAGRCSSRRARWCTFESSVTQRPYLVRRVVGTRGFKLQRLRSGGGAAALCH
jgi:hypothetical protein